MVTQMPPHTLLLLFPAIGTVAGKSWIWSPTQEVTATMLDILSTCVFLTPFLFFSLPIFCLALHQGLIVYQGSLKLDIADNHFDLPTFFPLPPER